LLPPPRRASAHFIEGSVSIADHPAQDGAGYRSDLVRWQLLVESLQGFGNGQRAGLRLNELMALSIAIWALADEVIE